MTVGSKRVLAAAGTSAVALVVLAGCNGSDPAPTASSSAPVTSRAPTTSTTSASPTTSATAGGMPEAAKANTPAGAEAFVRYFEDAHAKAWMEPNDKILPALCLSASKTCASLQKSAVALVNEKLRFDVAPIAIKSLTAEGAGPNGSTRFSMQGTQNAARVLRSDGGVEETVPEEAVSFLYTVTWTDGAWKISEINQGATQ